MSIVILIQITAAVVGSLLALGASIAVIYGAFKKAKNDEGRKADRELIDTLKTQNELLRTEKGDTSIKLEQALRELSEMRGEMKTLRELPLAATSQSLIDIVNLQRIILDNQVIAFKHLGIEGKLKVSNISSKEA